MAVTIKDVAREAGVSHTTVSRALRNKSTISAETANHVREVAARMGYVPNSAARGLKTNKSGVLGVIVRRIDDPFNSQILQGIEQVLQQADHSLFLAASNRDTEREREIVRSMSERRVDGILICSTQVDPDHRQQLEKFGMITVLINNQAQDKVDYAIYHDDAEGSRLITTHLIELGHTKIAYIGNGFAGRTNDERQRGYQEALETANISIEDTYIINAPNGKTIGGASSAQKLVSLTETPTAIVCFNDMMAIGAISALEKNNIRIPQDCSVTGFDDIQLAEFAHPPLTTFRQPAYQLGVQAAQMMLRLLNTDNVNQPTTLQLQGELIIRDSTARHLTASA